MDEWLSIAKRFHVLAATCRIKAVVVVLASFSYMPVYSADLLDIYRLALRNDPTFEVARHRLKAAQQKHPQALAGLLPTVNINGANNLTQAQTQFSNSPSINRNVHAWNWSLQLAQPLIRLQNLYAYDEADHAVEQAQAQYALAEQDMILRIIQAYFGVLSSREGIRVAKAEQAATEAQLALAQHGFEKGIAVITDVREGQSRVDLAGSHIVTAQNELDAKRAELAKIVDDIPEQLAVLDSAVFFPLPQPSDLQYWIHQARENNPAVRAAYSGLMVTEAIVGKARSEHAPTLDLIASYGGNYSSGMTALPTDYASKGQSKQLGIQFTVPLFAGGGVNSRVVEALSNKERVSAELEVARRQAATDARLAYAGVVSGSSQITALESAVLSSLTMVKQSHAGYQQGIYNNAKVLDAEQQYYTAQRDLMKARYEMLLQALKLKAATGTLSEADLINANTFFVPYKAE